MAHQLILVLVETPIGGARVVDDLLLPHCGFAPGVKHGGRFEYYDFGGRWSGLLGKWELGPARPGTFGGIDAVLTNNACPLAALPESLEPHGVVTPDGIWHVLDWWDPVRIDQSARDLAQLLSDYPDHWAVLIDAKV